MYGFLKYDIISKNKKISSNKHLCILGPAPYLHHFVGVIGTDYALFCCYLRQFASNLVII